MVRAKFKVDKIERTMSSRQKKDADGNFIKNERGYWETGPAEMQTVVMSPVYGNGDPAHENTKFWAASPSGQLLLGCVNEEASKYFELGKEYYIDFTKAGA
jgi:hypothetical protein